jgi:hypothetical protein
MKTMTKPQLYQEVSDLAEKMEARGKRLYGKDNYKIIIAPDNISVENIIGDKEMVFTPIKPKNSDINFIVYCVCKKAYYPKYK